MPNVVPTSHTAQDVQDVKDEIQKLLNKVKGFSFSHQIELVKVKFQEAMGAADSELNRLRDVTPESNATPRPFSDGSNPAAVAALAGPSGTPEQEKELEAAAAAVRQNSTPNVAQAAMTTQNVPTAQPEQAVTHPTNEEPETRPQQ